jgi:hypothetical protein
MNNDVLTTILPLLKQYQTGTLKEIPFKIALEPATTKQLAGYLGLVFGGVTLVLLLGIWAIFRKKA